MIFSISKFKKNSKSKKISIYNTSIRVFITLGCRIKLKGFNIDYVSRSALITCPKHTFEYKPSLGLWQL